MSASLIIRNGTLADLSEIVSVARISPGAPDWTDVQYEQILRAADRGSARRMAWVATADDKIFGFCIVSFVAEEADLESVVVSAERRREGLGKKLCCASLAWLREQGVKQVWLEVRESNNAARALYLSLGFDVTGTRPAYYAEPKEDAVVMRAFLNGTTHL